MNLCRHENFKCRKDGKMIVNDERLYKNKRRKELSLTRTFKETTVTKGIQSKHDSI
jgi:hypothetical protein